MQRYGTPVVISVVALVALVITLLTGLVYAGREIDSLVTAILTILPATLGLVIVSGRVDKIKTQNDEAQATLDNVERAVNGRLERQFADLHRKIETLGKGTDNV